MVDLILLQPGDESLFPAQPVSDSPLLNCASWGDSSALNAGRCIELVSIHQGIQNLASGHISSQPSKALLSDFTCVKYVDQTSVKLYEYCLSAKSLGAGAKQPTALHILRNSGDQTSAILTIQLRDAIISEIQLQSHPDDMPTEQFKLSFSEILWSYQVQNVQVASAAPQIIKTGWSVTHHRPISDFS